MNELLPRILQDTLIRKVAEGRPSEEVIELATWVGEFSGSVATNATVELHEVEVRKGEL